MQSGGSVKKFPGSQVVKRGVGLGASEPRTPPAWGARGAWGAWGARGAWGAWGARGAWGDPPPDAPWGAEGRPWGLTTWDPGNN